MLSTSHSYSAVRRVYTLGPTESSHRSDTTALWLFHSPWAIDTTSPNKIVRANLQSFTTLVPGSIKQVTQKLAVGIKQVRQPCYLFGVYVGDHWWHGMPGRIQFNLPSSCFKVPTKLAIGIKATVEKGEEEGKSWTPRFIQFHYDCDQMRMRWLSFVSFVNWFVWPQKAALARHRWCCLCEV